MPPKPRPKTRKCPDCGQLITMYALRCRSCDARYQRVVLQRVPDPTPEEIEVAKARLKAIHLEEMRLGIFRNFQTHRPKAG